MTEVKQAAIQSHTDLESIVATILDEAKRQGASAAEAGVNAENGLSVTVRLGEGGDHDGAGVIGPGVDARLGRRGHARQCPNGEAGGRDDDRDPVADPAIERLGRDAVEPGDEPAHGPTIAAPGRRPCPGKPGPGPRGSPAVSPALGSR